MSAHHSDIQELLHLTKLFLLEEMRGKKWIWSGQEDYTYFKKIADSQRKAKPSRISSESNRHTPQHLPTKEDVKHTSEKKYSPPPKQLNISVSIPPAPPPKHEPPTPKTPPKDTTLVPPTEKKAFQLQPLGDPKEVSLADFEEILRTKFPRYKIHQDTPDDSEAKQIKHSWKRTPSTAQALILAFDNSPPHRTFLNNVARAIRKNYGEAVVVDAQKAEHEKDWERVFEGPNLRLILANQNGTYAFPELRKFAESPLPFCFMDDVETYLREPKLKAALWRSIQDRFAKK